MARPLASGNVQLPQGHQGGLYVTCMVAMDVLVAEKGRAHWRCAYIGVAHPGLRLNTTRSPNIGLLGILDGVHMGMGMVLLHG